MWIWICAALSFAIQPDTIPYLEVVERWRTLGSNDMPFGYVAGVAQVRDGSVIIADTKNEVLHRVDPATMRFGVAARDGGGPGEVRTPTLMAMSPRGEVAVYDLGHGRVLFYDSALSPVRAVPISPGIMNPKGFAILHDGSIVLSGGAFRNEFGVHVFSPDGTLRGSYRENPPSQDPIASIHTAGGPVHALAGGGFIYSNSAPHQILLFDESLERTEIASDPAVIEPIVDRFNVPVVIEGRHIIQHRWYYDQSRAIFPLPGDYLLLNVITRRDRKDSLWELWTFQGELLERRRIARPYRPFVLNDGMILAADYDDATDEHALVALEFRINGYESPIR